MYGTLIIHIREGTILKTMLYYKDFLDDYVSEAKSPERLLVDVDPHDPFTDPQPSSTSRCYFLQALSRHLRPDHLPRAQNHVH